MVASRTRAGDPLFVCVAPFRGYLEFVGYLEDGHRQAVSKFAVSSGYPGNCFIVAEVPQMSDELDRCRGLDHHPLICDCVGLLLSGREWP